MGTLRLGDLVDETLEYLYRLTERPASVNVSGLVASITPTFTVAAGQYDHVAPSDILEIGTELLLVVSKSSDAVPTFTATRGYLGTTPTAHASGAVALKNTPWPRTTVARAVERVFERTLRVFVPNRRSSIKQVSPGLNIVLLDEDSEGVFEVRHDIRDTGRIVPVGGWEFLEDLPTSRYGSSKALLVPTYVTDSDELLVTERVPYTWDGSGEDATLDVPEGVDELPVLYAAARLMTGREISRTDIDKVEEWNAEEAQRQGLNLRLIRELWGDFYRALDEARRVNPPPKHRPYRKMPKV